MRARLARSEPEASALLHGETVTVAAIASEPGVGDVSLRARLSWLPSGRLVPGVGLAGDADMSRRARRAGAGAYLPRPVDARSLAMALACAGGMAVSHGLYVAEIPQEMRSRDSPGAGKGA